MTTLGSLVLHAVKGPVHVSPQALTLLTLNTSYVLALFRLAKVYGSDQTPYSVIFVLTLFILCTLKNNTEFTEYRDF